MIDLGEAEAAVTASIECYHRASTFNAEANLVALVLWLQENHPEVAYLAYDWSDQGDFLTPEDLWTAGLERVEADEYWADDMTFLGDLGEMNGSVWEPFVFTPTRKRDLREHGGYLDLNAIREAFADWTPPTEGSV